MGYPRRMGRRSASEKVVKVVVANQSVDIAAWVVEALPDIVQFMQAMVDDGTSRATAFMYGRLAAKAKRDGLILTPSAINSRTMLTAVNRYWKWVNEHYDQRVRPLLRDLPAYMIRDGLTRIRVAHLVGPFEGKMVPIEQHPIHKTQETMRPASGWTLHIPRDDNTPLTERPWEDPNCAVLDLDAKQLKVVADAFYAAWGNVDIASMPRECLLFGQPPLGSPFEKERRDPVGRVVGLMGDTAVAHILEQVHASMTPYLDTFLDRIRERPPDVLVVDGRGVKGGLPAALRAVADALEAQPTNGAGALQPEAAGDLH